MVENKEIERDDQTEKTKRRKILFRGKRVDTGEWIKGYFMKFRDIYTIQREDDEVFYCKDRVIPETVGQFTGLYDKNGKEIFEGDVLKDIDDIPRFERPMIIEYDRCGFGYKEVGYNCVTSIDDKEFGLEYFTDEFEVIGNIHDNPELLEVKDEN